MHRGCGGDFSLQMNQWKLILSLVVFVAHIVWPYCFCPIYPCMRPKTLLTRYLAEYLHIFTKLTSIDALWDRDERFTIWGQKVRGQGHGGIKYAGNCTFCAC